MKAALPVAADERVPMSLQLNWIKCGDDSHWCSLKLVNLDMKTEGVYVIWHEGDPGVVVRIGQGDIAARLGAHRNDPAILVYEKQGTVRVTWAAVSVSQRNGVEAFLAGRWTPLIGEMFPDADPLAVNLPF